MKARYTKKGRGEGGAYSFVACLSHLTIDRASLSKRRRGEGGWLFDLYGTGLGRVGGNN